MSKRFTATEKWSDPWFCELSMPDKLFWIYLLDNCDIAGIWTVNWRLVEFHIPNYKFNKDAFISRIHEISDGKWFIPKFIEFQHGQLKPTNNLHHSIILKLKNSGVILPLRYPSRGDQIKVKVKVTDKSNGDGVEGDYKTPNPKTEPLRALVWAYKCAKGFQPEDREWDKRNFPRYSKAAKELLEIFQGNAMDGAACIVALAKRFDSKALDWKLETIVKHAEEWKLKNGGSDGNIRDERFLRPIANSRSDQGTSRDGEFVTSGAVIGGIRNLQNIQPKAKPNSGARTISNEGTVEQVAEDTLEATEN